MKSFSLGELKSILPLLSEKCSYFVQDIETGEKDFSLKLYKNELRFLHFHLAANAPLVLESPVKLPFSKKTKPLLLFLKKYLKGALLIDVSLLEGRSLLFLFVKGDEEIFLEFRAFPHGQNLIAKTSDKQMSWFKVKEIPVSDFDQDPSERKAQDLMDEKIKEFKNKGSSAKKTVSKDLEAEKTKVIQQLEAALLDTSRLQQIESDFISLQADPEQIKILENYKISKDLPWFERIQTLKGKLENERSKKQKLQDRLQSLRTGKKVTNLPEAQKNVARIVLRTGKVLLLGKSAKENLLLLRQAKPWHLWIHLRDLPSSYGILQINKGDLVELSEIEEAALQVVKRSSLAKNLVVGDMFDVQHTECRFVKPIKGDKWGRAIVKNEKVLRFRFDM